MDDQPIVPVPAPWKLRATVYMVTFRTKAGDLPDFAYSPLEAQSSYAGAGSGEHQGGISQIQILRYSESPVGPYDELILLPGFFTYPTKDGSGDSVVTKTNARVTRIYVSQKYTCWNGRKNWNVPKHLARFEFDGLPDGATRIRVFPHDTSYDPAESQASETAFFQATIRPLRWLPSFPLSTGWLRHVGLDVALVQPPLPAGTGSQDELPGTDRWCRVVPAMTSPRACLAWVDMEQRDDASDASHAQHPNFWPGMARWQIGLRLDDTVVDFGEPEHWDVPPSRL